MVEVRECFGLTSTKCSPCPTAQMGAGMETSGYAALAQLKIRDVDGKLGACSHRVCEGLGPADLSAPCE